MRLEVKEALAGSFPVVFVDGTGRAAPRWPDAVREGLSTTHYLELCQSTLCLTRLATRVCVLWSRGFMFSGILNGCHFFH